ncbi:hypothetical protein CYLTODRAFT_427663 [Cylindrobasidium torrendii FP15055 ss-10]|uniref:Uncharacterized protein n=1 Tax=Cylindrobasidium torrendii FP15055 ss-10 TaxID=1314674 RepID=A0A0D7AS17_9AGAR|nr:hypothetical protein CYLTODRAFT_427663 [Cylindrobasidium torrendii FP15055 ss-10]
MDISAAAGYWRIIIGFTIYMFRISSREYSDATLTSPVTCRTVPVPISPARVDIPVSHVEVR